MDPNRALAAPIASPGVQAKRKPQPQAAGGPAGGKPGAKAQRRLGAWSRILRGGRDELPVPESEKEAGVDPVRWRMTEHECQ